MIEDIKTDQKAWQFICSLNQSDERLDAIAISDTDRDYTYRQFFRWTERYAEVFSGLGITEARGSRLGVVCCQAVSSLFSLFASNMLGVSVSLIQFEDFFATKFLLKAIEVEGITDLVLPAAIVRPDTLHEILLRRPDLGLRHIIVVETSRQTPCPNKRARDMLARNLQQIKAMPGVLMMSALLSRYAATPIAYGSGAIDEAAAIVHSSGTTKGTHKPIPLSDVALNTAAARMLVDERFARMGVGTVVLWMISLGFSTSLVNIVYASLAFGATIKLLHGVMDTLALPVELRDVIQEVNALTVPYFLMEQIMRDPKSKDIDLSSLQMIVFGGAPTSFDQMRRVKEFVQERGGDPYIVNGYGLSECGAANTIGVYDGTDHGIGQPLTGVKVRIRDEETGEFHAIDGTPHIGTIYLSSPSNSGGRLGDLVLFELEDIEGDAYVCTYDLVRSDERGDLFFVGRANRFFVNNDGMKFDASIVENALLSQEGISECAIVGAYEKLITHDTVPVLYVRVAEGEDDDEAVVRKAILSAYRDSEIVAQSNLPWMCVIVDELPHAASGKVDAVAVQSQRVQGREYTVAPVEREGKLVDVVLEPAQESTVGSGELSPAGIPPEVRQGNLDLVTTMAKTLGPDFLRQFARGGAPMPFAKIDKAAPGMGGMMPSGGAMPQLPQFPAPQFPMPPFPFMPGAKRK